MPQPDPHTIRLAIALTVLKLKPRDQSTASYLKDLQSRFPSATNDHDNRDWRMYALELERQLATFKAQRDTDQELFSKLLADMPQVASTSDAPPPKKKSKKNNNKDPHDSEFNWDQSRADLSRFLSSQYPPSPSLVTAYASLKAVLASPDADLASYASCLADVIIRALDTIRIFLFSSNSSLDLPARSIPSTSHIDSPRIAATSPLLHYVLRTAFPALHRSVQVNKRQRQRIATDPHALVDSVLDHLLECVLLPLLRALVPLSFERFAPLAAPPPKKTGRTAKGKNRDKSKDAHTRKTPDTRTDAFSLIAMSLDALDALPNLGTASSIAGGIRDRLGFETICELEALYAPPPTPPSAPPSQPQQSTVTESRVKRLERLAGTRAERVRVLATRDAGWLLASTLGHCVTSAPGGSGHPGQLREALLNRIGKLLRSMPVGDGSDVSADARLTIDPVCQNMLLAICERALTELASE